MDKSGYNSNAPICGSVLLALLLLKLFTPSNFLSDTDFIAVGCACATGFETLAAV